MAGIGSNSYVLGGQRNHKQETELCLNTERMSHPGERGSGGWLQPPRDWAEQCRGCWPASPFQGNLTPGNLQQEESASHSIISVSAQISYLFSEASLLCLP